MTTDQSMTSTANRFQRIAFLVGLAGLVLGLIGALTGSLDRFFQSYLLAFVFWLGMTMGSLAFLMIHFLTGSRWGLTVRRISEAAASTIWLIGLLFVPLLTNLPGLYVWARPDAVQASASLQEKSLFLNTPFFIIRAVIYFAIWIALSYFINRLSAQWTESGNPDIKERLKGLSAFGLIIYALTMTFAALDWMMSLEPYLDSTVYGLIIMVGQLLSSLSFAVLVLNLIPGLGLGRQWNLKTTPMPFKDLGTLMITFILGWAYLAFFQLLIVWAANLPHEVTWYYNRIQGGWLTVGVLVAVLQFALPFAILITRHVRNNLRLLAWLGGFNAVIFLVNLYWMIIPAFHPGQFSLHWLDIVMPIALGGLWVSAFLFALKKRPAIREAEQASLEAKTEHQHAVS